MSEMTPIQYMGFYDVPLIFMIRYRGQTYLFDCPFDEEREEDSDAYKVYILPDTSDQELPKDWTTLCQRATRYLGEVPVSGVRFDPTMRKAVDASIIESLTAEKPVLG